MSATPPLDPALYESQAWVPITAVAVTLGVATLCVGLRTYCRAVMIRQFGWDDWCAILAVVLAIGSGLTVATSTRPLFRVLSDPATDDTKQIPSTDTASILQ